MAELVIKYKNKKTLDALIDFSKYFYFSVIMPKKAVDEKSIGINGVTRIKPDKSIDRAFYV